MLTGLIEEAFNYQIDILVPNCDTSFSELKDNLFDKHKYFLLSQVSLDQLLTRQFIDNFVKKGQIYMLSYNTRLDCHDCVCLLPNSNLILHVEESTFQKIPRNFSKKTCKSTGYTKYEVNIMLNELEDDKKAQILKDILKKMSFSFYVCWLPESPNTDAEIDLKNYFGLDKVSKCLNRIETDSFQLSSDLVSQLEDISVNEFESWLKVENLTGCLINNIEPENLLTFVDSAKKTNTISILRVKGFMPNKYLNIIMNEYLKGLFELSEVNKRVFIKLHGFQDSPVGLFNLGSTHISNIRLNQENFLSICCEKNTTSDSVHNCLFNDHNNCYLINF